MGKNIIHFVGLNHQGPEFKKFMDFLVRQAAEGRIVVGLEGAIRSDSYEQSHLREAYGIEGPTHAYGVEDPFAYVVSSVFKSHVIWNMAKRDEHQDMREIVSIASLVHDLELPALRDAWNSLGGKILPASTTETMAKVSAVFQNTYGMPKRMQAQIIKAGCVSGQFGSADDWCDLFKRIGCELVEMVESLPEDKKSDIGKFRGLIENPADEEKYTYVAVDWRDQFVHPNLRFIADVGVREKKDVFFPMGSLHADNFYKEFKPSYKTMDVKMAASSASVPDEYMAMMKKSR